MKILIMCDIFDENIASQENILAKYFLKHGHEVSILTSTFESVFDFIANKYDSKREGKIQKLGSLKVIRRPYRLNLLHKLRSFRGARNIIYDESPDMVFMLDIMPDMIEVVRYKKDNPNCRFVMDYHADYSNSGRNLLSIKVLHGIIRKSILGIGMPSLDAIYPVTPASADFLHEVYSVPRDRMELLPLGADMDLGLAIASRNEGRDLRRQLGISEDTVVIFSGGKFARLKRTEILIEAVRRLKHLPIELIIVGAANIGEEAYAGELKQAASGDPHIHFVGWLNNSDLFRYMDMADLAVFPASQSILWVQAVSMGLPLIVGNMGAQDTYYMNPYGNIIELPAEDIHVDKITATLESVLRDPARLGRMQEGARRTFTEVLDWDMLARRATGELEPAFAPTKLAAG
ncbi:glycosyltransferase family 4 protein [Allosphingosinicella flava]|uniref:Glycosyltransferase family 4 protein n=1 Tax=Allosphingosinicella flava TaxID=2771430 RepID=A0A7T2GIE9_9SPHN|nr:glycosyltransferase family 4 protein [Sphingosinicella flava]QPQ54426.1 glycosyltransferase family 4 protein [Sphingosinicella flava]